MDLWHHRLGHMNFRDLTYLSNHEIVRRLPKLGKPSNAICGPCQLGKQTRAAHKKINAMVTSYPLELIHIDLMGPTWTESLGGKKYIFLAVDDYFRFS